MLDFAIHTGNSGEAAAYLRELGAVRGDTFRLLGEAAGVVGQPLFPGRPRQMIKSPRGVGARWTAGLPFRAALQGVSITTTAL